MIDHEIERIAAAINHLRPDWPKTSLATLLRKPELRDRPRRDVAVALTWVACEAQTVTPARVLEAGPWWQAAATGGSAQTREPFDPTKFCGICSWPEHRCRTNPHAGHEFASAVETARNARPRSKETSA